MNRAAKVQISGQLAGHIEELGDQTVFTYAPAWLAHPGAEPVSLTLPLRPEPYVSQGLHPFFENLLPEGWFLDIASKKLKVSKSDAFGLLIGTCGDCAGAVEVFPLDPDGDGEATGEDGLGDFLTAPFSEVPDGQRDHS